MNGRTASPGGHTDNFVLPTVTIAVLILVGLGTYRLIRVRARARAKADRLIVAYRSAGRTPPSKKDIVRALGDDGGAVSVDPRLLLELTDLPVPLVRELVGIYCPDQLYLIDAAVPGQAGAGLNEPSSSAPSWTTP